MLDKEIDDKIGVYNVNRYTIQDCFDEFMEKKKKLKNTTRSNYTGLYQTYIEPSLGGIRVKVLDSDMLEDFFQKCTDEGLAANTVHSIHTLLSSMLKLAVRKKYIRENCAVGILDDIELNTESKKEEHALTIEEEMVFIKELEREENRMAEPLFKVALATGMRIGELAALCWDDIDYAGGMIKVQRSLAYYKQYHNNGKCGYELKETKTEAGKRKIPLSEMSLEALEKERLNQEYTGIRNS